MKKKNMVIVNDRRCDICGKRGYMIIQPDGWRVCEKCNKTRLRILKVIR